eukprot:1102290-Amphidinium_carterae.1
MRAFTLMTRWSQKTTNRRKSDRPEKLPVAELVGASQHSLALAAFLVLFKELITKGPLGALSATTQEQIVRAKPDALLCTLLDDPARNEDASIPIFVEAHPGRFHYIVDWYRYGSICLPHNISVKEMQRECAFFQLPDGLSIEQECVRPPKALKVLQGVATKAQER